MVWTPRVTVATVVCQDARYLLVEENSDGSIVFNQPAGHLEENESLMDAAVREAFEETGWHVQLTRVLGLGLYRSPINGLTYLRTTFLAHPLHEDLNHHLDTDIIATHWLTYEEILARKDQLRSPVVLADVEAYREGRSFPLELLREF